MKVLKVLLVLLLFSLVVFVIGSVIFLLANFWSEKAEVRKDDSLNTNGQKINLRTAMRIPNNKLNVVKKRRSAVAPYIRNRITKQNADNRATAPTNVIRKVEGSPRFPNMHDAVLELDSTKYTCNDTNSTECAALTSTYGGLVNKELSRVMIYDSSVFRAGSEKENIYNVRFGGAYGQRFGREELVCALNGVRMSTVPGLVEEDAPLHAHRYNTCAVVSSAGALLGSRLGHFIDSHDMVLRFNNAPTENYTEDVGSKTTIRIVNSQVVAKREYNFLEDPLYRNISILIWDPANYTSTLEDWYRSPDYPLFQIYKKFMEVNPDADIHLLNPQVLWDLWNLLQSSAPNRIRKNPPSSGFIGIWFALQRCANVRVFEYVPSTRATARCHYYSAHMDRHCTLGSWHPLAQEKALANLMRNNSDFEAYQRGFINVPGVVSLNCPF